MQLPERNAVSAVSSPSIVGQIRIGRDIHGRDEHEARLPAQEARGIAHARAAAGAAAMFGRARPAPPPWLCSAGLCGAGSAPPLMSARGGPATCASRPPHGSGRTAQPRHRAEEPGGRARRAPAAAPGRAAPAGRGVPAPPDERRQGRDRTVTPPKLPPCQQVSGGARLRKTGKPATKEPLIVPAPFWSHAC